MTPEAPERHRAGRSLMPVILVLGVLAVGLAVVGRLAVGSRTSKLPIQGEVPSFELVDQTGSPYPSTRLEGKIWVASFIYTTCPGPCPRVVERLAALERTFAGDPRVHIVSFSVDPEADTPAVLGAYGRSHAIDPKRWSLLTGPPEVQLAVVRKGFLLSVARTDLEGDAVPADGPVIHSTRLVLVDDASRIRGYYDSDDPAAMEKLTADVRRLLARL